MKIIISLILTCSFFQGSAQLYKYSINVDISSRVDTINNQDKKEIYHLFKNYLEARPDSFYNNPYWTNKEKTGTENGVIAGFYKGFSSRNLSPEKLFGNWKPYILTIEKIQYDKYLLRVALISETERADKILTILNVNAIKENRHWVLENTFNDIVNSWHTKQYKYIKYKFPDGYKFNEKLAQRSVKVCDSIAAILHINKIDTFTFFICDNADKIGLLSGYEFYNENYTTGYTDPDSRFIFSAKGNEFYPHEFMHCVFGSYKDKAGAYINYIIEEGLACFFGEYGTDNYLYKFYYLAEDYLTNKPTYNIHHLLTNTNDNHGYSAAYSTGVIIAEIIYEKRGYRGLIELLNSYTKTEEDIYKAIFSITKMDRIEFEKAFRDKLTERYKLFEHN